jgi:hypothetical protein
MNGTILTWGRKPKNETVSDTKRTIETNGVIVKKCENIAGGK